MSHITRLPVASPYSGKNKIALRSILLATLTLLFLSACGQGTPTPATPPQPSAAAKTAPPVATPGQPATPGSAQPTASAPKPALSYTAFWQPGAVASTASNFAGAPLPTERGLLFSGSGACAICHTNLVDQAGKDISNDKLWRSTMLANAARDPYWRATVRSEVNLAPQLSAAIQQKCAACHTPMAEVTLAKDGKPALLLDQGLLDPANPLHVLGSEGVSCTLCHQVTAEKLGKPESFSGGYGIDTATPPGQRLIYGPYQTGRNWSDLMQSTSGFIPEQGLHMATSETCGTCHDLYTPYVDGSGKVAGEFAEQLVYSEWRNSGYAKTRTCQDCHMPAAPVNTRISTTGGPMRQQVTQHILVGGNAYMVRLLQQNGAALQVAGDAASYAATIQQTVDLVGTRSARLALEKPRLENGALLAEVLVENLAGHKFPAGFPSRRAWLHIRVLDKDGKVVFESGAVSQNGAIAGNDNDTDPARFEPHYTLLTGPDQVQIYEGIMADTDGKVTTTLLRGAVYIKDNRLLPAGFTPDPAKPELNPQGDAVKDANFSPGSDRLSLQIALGGAQGPFTLEVSLLYQTIAFRWAENLAQEKGAEISVFKQYYDALPNLPLSAASARVVVAP